MRFLKQFGLQLSNVFKLGLLVGMVGGFIARLQDNRELGRAMGLTVAASMLLMLVLYGALAVSTGAQRRRTSDRMRARGPTELDVAASRFAAGDMFTGRLAKYPDSIRFWGDEPLADVAFDRTPELVITALSKSEPRHGQVVLLSPMGDTTDGYIFVIHAQSAWVVAPPADPRENVQPAATSSPLPTATVIAS